MENNLCYDAKVYLKNGLVLEEVIVGTDVNMSKEDIEEGVNQLREFIKKGLKGSDNFQLTIDNTIIRGSEIVAITIKERR